jgi:hypothetical protein
MGYTGTTKTHEILFYCKTDFQVSSTQNRAVFAICPLRCQWWRHYHLTSEIFSVVGHVIWLLVVECLSLGWGFAMYNFVISVINQCVCDDLYGYMFRLIISHLYTIIFNYMKFKCLKKTTQLFKQAAQWHPSKPINNYFDGGWYIWNIER